MEAFLSTSSPHNNTTSAGDWMKVVVLGYMGYPDQGATYFYEVTQALASLGQQVTALALRRDGEAMCEQVGGALVKRVAPKIAYRQVGKLAFFRAAARSIRTEQPDVVHCYSTLGLWVLRRLAGSGQVWVHVIQSAAVTGWHPAVNWVENRLRARQSSVFDFTVVVAPSVAHKLFGGQGARVSVLPDGVNLDRFSPAHRRDLRPTLGVPSDAVLACYIGALHGARRLDTMIRAAAHAMAATSTLHVVVIGDGPDRRRLEALASSLAPGRFVFLGYRPYTEIPVYMASSDIGLSFLPPGWPTYDDQPPLKVMEYLASGLPTVATAMPAHQSLIQEAVNGLLTEATSEAFGQAIMILASDKVLRGMLSDRCRGSIAHRDWRMIVEEQLLPIYTRLLLGRAKDCDGRNPTTIRHMMS